MNHSATPREPGYHRVPHQRMSAAEKRRRAARRLADHAHSPAELSEWLEMLGLSADQRR